MTSLRIDRDSWEKNAQPGELLYHQRSDWRAQPDFFSHTIDLFQFFGFKSTDFACKTVLDLGAGSRLRSGFFLVQISTR